jgi:hypothetical protein
MYLPREREPWERTRRQRARKALNDRDACNFAHFALTAGNKLQRVQVPEGQSVDLTEEMNQPPSGVLLSYRFQLKPNTL